MKRECLNTFLFCCLLIVNMISLSGQVADLELTMSSNPVDYEPETPIEFLLELSNSGDTATDVSVFFLLPDGTSLLGISSNNGSYLSQTGIWSITQVVPNDVVRLNVRAYNFNTTEPIKAFAQVIRASLPDPDSTPNNNTSGIATEDDETQLTIYPNTFPTKVEFSNFPEDEQLYPRQIQNNQGLIDISGIATAGRQFSSLRAKLYREDVFEEDFFIALDYVNDTAHFQIHIPILAELANYSIELYGVDIKEEESLIAQANQLVAGDVYVINGQSNAQANVAPFSTDNRLFSRGYSMERGWTNAQFVQPGPGQWGARMAAEIIDEQAIPVAIFNEAVGGKRIDFYLKDPINPDTGNYGDLYRRLEAAGVREEVRAGFWFQGEADGWVADETFLDTYKDKFKSIHRAWLEDYTIEKCYIFQVRYQSCLHLFPYVMEAQRQLQHELPNIATMSTTNTAHDSCHYYYEQGYEALGNRVYDLMASELYGTSDYNVAAPDIRRAYFSGARELTIELRNVQGELLIVGNPWQEFKLEGTDVEILNGRTEGTRIILELSEEANGVTGISYYAHVGATPPWVLNDAEVGLLTFYNHPIESLPEESADLEVLLETIRAEYEQFRPIEYEVIIRNTSDMAATNVELEVPVPAGTAFTSSEVSMGRYFSWENRWLIDVLPANTSARLTATVFPLVGNEQIIVYAQVTDTDQNDPDSTPDNGTQAQPSEDDEARLLFSPAQQQIYNEETDIALSLFSDTQEYGIYNSVNYLLRIKNQGNIAATNLEIDLSVATEFAYTSHIASMGHYDNWNTIWNIPELTMGEIAELHLTLFTLTEDGTLEVAASLNGLDQEDNNATNNEVNWIITPVGEAPQLSHTNQNTKAFQAFPSLVEDELQVVLNSETNGTKSFRILDLQGRTLLRETLNVHQGYQRFHFDCTHLQAGVYILQLEGSPSLLKMLKN